MIDGLSNAAVIGWTIFNVLLIMVAVLIERSRRRFKRANEAKPDRYQDLWVRARQQAAEAEERAEALGRALRDVVFIGVHHTVSQRNAYLKHSLTCTHNVGGECKCGWAVFFVAIERARVLVIAGEKPGDAQSRAVARARP